MSSLYQLDLGRIPEDIQAAMVDQLVAMEDSTNILLFFGRYLQHMSIEDLAERLQISKQRVSSKLRKIHDKIRRRYEINMGVLGKPYLVSTVADDPLGSTDD